MKYLLIPILLALSPSLYAKEPMNFLVCKGHFSSYGEPNVRDLPDSGIVELDEKSLRLFDFVVFGGGTEGLTYSVTHKSETFIVFRLSANKTVEGILNRYTGTIKMSVMRTPNQLGELFDGVCEVGKQLF